MILQFFLFLIFTNLRRILFSIFSGYQITRLDQQQLERSIHRSSGSLHRRQIACLFWVKIHGSASATHLSRQRPASGPVHNQECISLVLTIQFHRTAKTVTLDTAFCCNILPRAAQEVSCACCTRNPLCFNILPASISSLLRKATGTA